MPTAVKTNLHTRWTHYIKSNDKNTKGAANESERRKKKTQKWYYGMVLYFRSRIEFGLYIINNMEIYARTIFNSISFGRTSVPLSLPFPLFSPCCAFSFSFLVPNKGKVIYTHSLTRTPYALEPNVVKCRCWATKFRNKSEPKKMCFPIRTLYFFPFSCVFFSGVNKYMCVCGALLL